MFHSKNRGLKNTEDKDVKYSYIYLTREAVFQNPDPTPFEVLSDCPLLCMPIQFAAQKREKSQTKVQWIYSTHTRKEKRHEKPRTK